MYDNEGLFGKEIFNMLHRPLVDQVGFKVYCEFLLFSESLEKEFFTPKSQSRII